MSAKTKQIFLLFIQAVKQEPNKNKIHFERLDRQKNRPLSENKLTTCYFNIENNNSDSVDSFQRQCIN